MPGTLTRAPDREFATTPPSQSVSRSNSEREYSPPDNCSHGLLSSEKPEVAVAVDDGAALDRLIGRWADAAVGHATVRRIEDPAGLVATVFGISGAWGFGESTQEALGDLRSVLVDWAVLKLEDGDDDIPSMEGVHLVVDG